ncbi:hypothetical protein [Vibrio chagasii]|nr:hypothetical protein [Vibrio chagasii]
MEHIKIQKNKLAAALMLAGFASLSVKASEAKHTETMVVTASQ